MYLVNARTPSPPPPPRVHLMIFSVYLPMYLHLPLCHPRLHSKCFIFGNELFKLQIQITTNGQIIGWRLSKGDNQRKQCNYIKLNAVLDIFQKQGMKVKCMNAPRISMLTFFILLTCVSTATMDYSNLINIPLTNTEAITSGHKPASVPPRRPVQSIYRPVIRIKL